MNWHWTWLVPRDLKEELAMEIGMFTVELETFSRELALAHIRRGYSAYRRDDLTLALAEFLEAKKLLPEDPYTHYLIGRTLLKFHRPREARSDLLSCLKLCPTFVDAHYQLGKTYLEQSSPDLDAARKAFEGELASYSCHGRAHWALYKIAKKQGDRERARCCKAAAARHGFRPERRTTKKTPALAVSVPGLVPA
jgi:tetratricopeptide (TPR) repeat protein